MKVRDVMTSPAVSLPGSASVAEAAATMVRHRIGSVVVVADDDPHRVRGLFAEAQLEVAEAMVPMAVPTAHAMRLMDFWTQDSEQFEEALASVARRPLAEVMRAPVTTVEADTELWVAMSTIARLEIVRMPVLEDGRLVGLVARHDLLKAVAALASPRRAPQKPPTETDVARSARPSARPGE